MQSNNRPNNIIPANNVSSNSRPSNNKTVNNKPIINKPSNNRPSYSVLQKPPKFNSTTSNMTAKTYSAAESMYYIMVLFKIIYLMSYDNIIKCF